jgi:hypothetical protein
MSCSSTCPAQVIDVLANQASDLLGQIQRIVQLTYNFNGAFLQMLVVKVTDDLDAWIAAIPLPPTVSLTAILEYLTCPLTPLSLLENPGLWGPGPIDYTAILSNTPPGDLYRQLTQQWRQSAKAVRVAYEKSTAALNSAFLVQFMRMYKRELNQALGDPYTFSLNLATALGNATYVSQVCPDIYQNPAYPFAQLTEVLNTFTFDGFLPNGFDPSVLPVLNKVIEAETRILGWQTLLVAQV